MVNNDLKGKALGGVARAKSLTPEQRKDISAKAIAARWDKAEKMKNLPSVILKNEDLKIVGFSIPCAIIEGDSENDVRRVLTEAGIYSAIFGAQSGASKRIKRASKEAGAPIPVFLAPGQLKPYINNDLIKGLLEPIEYADGSKIITGYDARILPVVCDIWLKAREYGSLQKQQLDKAQKAEILMRGLAHVGIIALVDEATGYQAIRAKNALAEILEAFVAKELQPWVKTFPSDYYQELFRLRGLNFPNDSVKRPQYFGTLTNDIIYKRLAPGVLEELKKITKKNQNGRSKHKLFQNLTSNIGYPKLREHLGAVIAVMRFSDSYKEFIEKLDRHYPRYGETSQIPFSYENDHDEGEGI